MKKTQKKSKSSFGINDCHLPKKNFTLKQFTKRRSIRKKRIYDYKSIVLFPHSLGQSRGGVEKAPRFLKKFIHNKKHTIKNVKNTGNFFKNLTDLYRTNSKLDGKIINIGGDHSMAISTIADTLNKFPNAKVIYFDAHADINTYDSSNSKHYHGMPLSFVTGLDHDTKISFIQNLLPFQNLLYIGSRCWDIFEIQQVSKHNISFLTPNDINNHFEKSLNIIMNFVGNSPIHVSFDVDSIDPKYIPSTGTPVKNGIELNNAIQILDSLNNANIVKVDITELNLDNGTKKEAELSGTNTELLFHKFID